MEPTEITLGERTYAIKEIPLRPSEAWRKRLDEPLREMLHLVEQGEFDMGDTQEMLGLANQIRQKLASSVELITELVLAWDPKLEADREYIFDNAYPSQIMEAFTVILRYAFPFGRAVAAIQRLSGQANGQT